MGTRLRIRIRWLKDADAAVAPRASLRGVIGHIAYNGDIIRADGALVINDKSAGLTAIGDVVGKDDVVDLRTAVIVGRRRKARLMRSGRADDQSLHAPVAVVHLHAVVSADRAGKGRGAFEPCNVVARRAAHHAKVVGEVAAVVVPGRHRERVAAIHGMVRGEPRRACAQPAVAVIAIRR